MSEKLVLTDEIIVDLEKYDLDAALEKDISTWMRVALKVLSCLRHQTAAIAILAIVVIFVRIEARPQDSGIVICAMGFISMIAISAEWIDRKHDDNQRRQSAAEPRHAS